MNLKRLFIIFLIFATLILSIGFISAADENIEVLSKASNIDEKVISENTKYMIGDRDDDDDDDDDDDYRVYKKSPRKTNYITKTGKIQTEVDADPISVMYKKNNYFKIEVEDRYDDDIPISHVKLKVKIGTGSKAKTYKVKTNSYGVAKINTKKLGVGTHKVVITSNDAKYIIKKTSKITVGKYSTVTIDGNAKSKVLKNNDIIQLITRYDDDGEKEVQVSLKKAKHTKIIKAQYYLKDKYTGRQIVKTDHAEFDDGRWEWPEEDFSNRFTLTKVKVFYVSTK